MRSSSAARIAFAATAVAALGCSSPQSFVILLLESQAPSSITGVANVEVTVMKANQSPRVLTYGARDLAIPPDASVAMGTLSVSFAGDQTGDVEFDVRVRDVHGCQRGHGAAIITIKRGATVEGLVLLAPDQMCPTDGGTDGAPRPGAGFPGCDPVHPVCAGGQTCQVNCTAEINACTPGGTGAPGSPCQGNADCAPGSQCFDYTSLGCATKVCLRFCGKDSDCGGPSDAGGGPGSFCRDPVTCGSTATGYRTCSASCDPTAAAALANQSGCPGGLACVLPASMDQVACACPEPTRKGLEGATCTSATQFAPGFMCQQTCRAICRCDEKNAACTAPAQCPTPGTTCTPLPGESLYGVCL
ncbi:MAG TPA: hypothetical protein VHO67_22005 [Polyangia bacterium]|nr:hypothetical protein [Polyangia bacterium]